LTSVPSTQVTFTTPTTNPLASLAESDYPFQLQLHQIRTRDFEEDFGKLYRRGKPKAAKPPPPPKAAKPPPPPKAPPPPGEKPKKLSLGQRIKAHFQRVGASIKHFFHKVGEGIKTVGLKIAKFAVKAASIVHNIAGKVVGLVCKPLGRAISAGAMAEGKLADKLNSMDHHQSAKEQKAWHGMDIAAHPTEYAAKAMLAKAEKTGNKAKIIAAKVGGIALQAAF